MTETLNTHRNMNRIECIPSREKRKKRKSMHSCLHSENRLLILGCSRERERRKPQTVLREYEKIMESESHDLHFICVLFFYAQNDEANPKQNNTKFEVDPRLTQRPKSFHCAHKQYVNLNCRFVEKGEPAGSSYINNTLISAMCATDHFS